MRPMRGTWALVPFHRDVSDLLILYLRNLTLPCYDTWHHLNVPTVVGSLRKCLAVALVRYDSLTQSTKM